MTARWTRLTVTADLGAAIGFVGGRTVRRLTNVRLCPVAALVITLSEVVVVDEWATESHKVAETVKTKWMSEHMVEPL